MRWTCSTPGAGSTETRRTGSGSPTTSPARASCRRPLTRSRATSRQPHRSPYGPSAPRCARRCSTRCGRRSSVRRPSSIDCSRQPTGARACAPRWSAASRSLRGRDDRRRARSAARLATGRLGPELTLAGWRQRLAEAGWATPTWPARLGGRDLPASAAGLVAATLAEFGAVGPPEGVGMSLAAPTLLEHGRDELQARFLPPTVTGEITWCQLFSEPGAGSDLAGLTTKAEFTGHEWRVSGQKVWNTSAHHADYGLL